MSEERSKAEVVKHTVETAGWEKVILPWVLREKKNALTKIKMAASLKTEDVLKEYLLNIGQLNHIERLLKMLDAAQGIKRKDEEFLETTEA